MRWLFLVLAGCGCRGDVATDEGEEACGRWYADADGDGYGDSNTAVTGCEAPDGHVEVGGDCDDADAATHPGREERCDGLDEDCDGEADQGLATSTWYVDADGDGHGDDQSAIEACGPLDGRVATGEDCDDEDAAVHPDAEETCDGVDEDCDGEVDDGVTTETWYADEDGDGHGDEAVAVEACAAPAGYVAEAGDCDDTLPEVHPGVTDACNGVDDDCDGGIDEDATTGEALMTIDTDAGWTYAIDPATAAMTEVTSTSALGTRRINTFDVRQDGLAIVQDHVYQEMLTLDVCLGTVTELGGTGVGNLCGIAFGPGGVLYGLDSTNDQLVEIDTATGAATVVGSLGVAIGNCGLAYDCATDRLIGANASTAEIFEVDPSTGVASGFVTTGVPFSGVGLEFDPVSQQLYAATGSARELYVVDPATGATSYIGPLDGTNADDLAFHAECP